MLEIIMLNMNPEIWYDNVYVVDLNKYGAREVETFREAEKIQVVEFLKFVSPFHIHVSQKNLISG